MPRPPRAPRAPAAPRAPRLRLQSYRTPASRELDGEIVKPRGEEPQPVPPFIRWSEFHAFLDENWEAGEHLSIVGQTGSGKTVLTREVLDIRSYVVVVSTKREDDSITPLVKERGYVEREDFDPADLQDPRIVFRAPLAAPTVKAEAEQREKLRKLLRQLYLSRGWTVVIDEVAYLSKDLKLDRELNALWREGRSAATTVVAGTQRPVNVPRNMWEQATHVVSFKITGREDRATASEYMGELRGAAFETMARLDRHEFLYVDAITPIAVRSRVELGRR